MALRRAVLLVTLVPSGVAAGNACAASPLTLDPFSWTDATQGGDRVQSPPPYTALRYNEDYSQLVDPALRTDTFDSLKYIPLIPGDRYSYLSLGGEFRERFEHYRNPAFGITRHHDEFLLQRLTFYADLHINDHARIFLEGISGLTFFENQHPYSPVDEDVLDIQQGFVDLSTGLHADTNLTFRAGRWEMSYGSGRLIATRAAPNIPLKFDGLGLYWKTGETKIDAWLVRPVAERPYEFDGDDDDQVFWGIYSTTPLGGKLNTTIDLYYLGLQNRDARYADGDGAEERHTLGTRLFGKVDNWDYDIEPVFQAGRLGDNNILAWTFASDIGYTLPELPWSPRFGIKADVASGDTRRGDRRLGTFNPLFFKSGYFNDASLIRPSNIFDVHPSVTLMPRSTVQIVIASDVYWRYSQQDAIYGVPGNTLLPAGGGGGSFLGTTAEASCQWQINRHLAWNVSYVHMFAGEVISRSDGGDVNFIGTWLTFTW